MWIMLFQLYTDPVREPILPFHETCSTTAIPRVSLFPSSVSPVDANIKNISGGG